jgi:23S rRNA (uracil1939-C5)-methyltransferase
VSWEATVRIRAIGAGGVGVGNLSDGRIVFVPRTAPGDRVRVRLTQERERWARGETVHLLEGGDGRVAPPCPHFERCDGCALQHLSYEEQLSAKGGIVGEALRRLGGLPAENPPVEPSPLQVRYRSRITLLLRRLGGGRVVAGFRDRQRRTRILDIGPECLLPEEGIADLWSRLREGWGGGARHLPPGRELRLELRGVGEEGSLLIQGGRGDGDSGALMDAVPGLVSVWRRESAGSARLVAGEPFMEVSWLDERVRLKGGAFIQVNRSLGEGLHRHVLQLAGEAPGRRVVEGFAGIGALGRVLAARGATVVSIESDADAVEEARRDRPPGYSPVLGRVEELLPQHLPADLLLLNPPRGGIAPEVTGLLRETPVPRVIYVSCDPSTLARDLKRMGDGYSIESCKAFDLFPQTAHIETVVSLGHRGS